MMKSSYTNIVEAKLHITCKHPKTLTRCEYNVYLYAPTSDPKVIKRQDVIIKKLRTKLKKFLCYKEDIIYE